MARFLEDLSEKIRARNIAKGRAEGRAEGRAKRHAEWKSWNERRLQAEARGEPFDEPSPGSEDAEGHIEGVGDEKMSDESTQQSTPKIWKHKSGQAEFILQPLSESLIRVTHRDQVGYIGINQNWDVAAPYSWTFMEGTTGPGGDEIERHARPDGIHRKPIR